LVEALTTEVGGHFGGELNELIGIFGHGLLRRAVRLLVSAARCG
jgi:hypothetical protein